MVGPRLFSAGPTYEGARVFYSQNRVLEDEHVRRSRDGQG